jgi:hypothetical protein
MSNTSSKGTKKPSIYIDTCIARDVTERRNDVSIEILGRIEREGWSCKMSVFGLMELVDIEQESIFVNKRFFIEKHTLDQIISSRRNRNLEEGDFEKCLQYIAQFQNKYSFVKLVGLDDGGWSLALVLASCSNLHASDVIHLVSAWQADCDVVVTNDTFFINEAKRYLQKEGIWDKLRVCKPEDCYSVLAKMGYTNI